MASQVEIINGALGLVGGEAIAQVPADINNSAIPSRSRWAVRLYNVAYESVLGAWPWADARRRYQLTKSGTAPAFDYTGQYELDAKILRVHAARTLGYPWEREGRLLLCSSGADKLNIVAIERVAPEQLIGIVADAVSARLAHRISMAASEGEGKQERLKKHARDCLVEAAQSDNWEGSSEQLMSSGWWLAAKTSYAPEEIGQPRPGMSWLEE